MKIRKFLAICLSLFTLTMTACQLPNQKQKETDAPTSTLLMGFESVRELLSIYVKNIGEIGICEEADKVKEGNSSMRVSYMHEVGETEYAKDMQIALMPGNKYFTKQKYLDTSYVAIDVYNASERTYQMAVQINAELNTSTVTREIYELEPGWNEVYTYIDRASFEYLSNGAISYCSLIFRGQQGESPDFYVDNFRYYTTDIEYEKYEFDYDKTVWHTFSHGTETVLMGTMGTPESEFSRPRISLNYDANYIASGKSSLKIDFFKKRNGAMDCTAVRTKNYLMPDLNDYLGEDNWYIFFDVYNAYEYEIEVQVVVFSDYNDETYGVTVKIPAKSWSNTENSRIYLNDLEDAYTGSGVNAMCIAYYFKGIQSEGSVYLDAIGIRK